jgi:tetratricopeptide (TPR) repeat protein
MRKSNLTISFFLFLFFLPNNTNAEKLKVLIDNFSTDTMKKTNLRWIPEIMYDKITSKLSSLDDLIVITHEDRKKVSHEIARMQRLGVDDLDSEEDEKDIFSKQAKPDLILNGKIQLIENQLISTIKITRFHSTQTSVIVQSEKYRNDTLEDYLNKLLLKIITELEKDDGVLPFIKVTEKSKEDLKIKKIYNSTAIEFYFKGKESSTDEFLKAKEYYLKAIELEPEYFEAITALGSIYTFQQNNFNQADIEYNKAKEIMKKNNETNSFAYYELLSLIATNYYSWGDYSESVEMYNKAKVGLETLSLNQSLSMAYIDYGLGICYSAMNQKVKSLDYLDKSKKIFEALKMTNNIGYANLLYAVAYSQLSANDLNNSLENYKKSQSIYIKKNMENHIVTANSFYSVAYIYERIGDKKKAGINYKKSNEIYEKIGYNGREVQIVRDGAKRNGY